MHAEINVRFKLSIDDDKTIPLAVLAEFVTDQNVRVFAPPGMDTVRVCPNCPDMVREGGDVREAKSPR